MDEYVPKPINLQDLSAAITSVTGIEAGSIRQAAAPPKGPRMDIAEGVSKLLDDLLEG